MDYIVYTFYIAALPVALLCGLLQLSCWLRNRGQQELALWAAGDLVGFCGALLVVAREHVPWWVSTALGNSIIVGASFLVWAGMRRFSGQTVPLRTFAVCTLAFFVIFHGMWFLTHDLAMRVLLTSMALTLLNAGIALDLTRSQQQQRLRTRSFLATLFALHALFYLFRSVTAVTLEAGDEFLNSGGIQNVALIVGTLKLALWNGVVLLMRRERHRQNPQLAAA
ncbi:MAG: hypothetical protein V4650_14095 [Pseudomonadota bacterium]